MSSAPWKFKNKQLSSVVSTLAMLSLIGLSSACGGGGGGGGSTPTPSPIGSPSPTPTPVANKPPKLMIQLSSENPDESTPLLVDFSGSSDKDGQIVRAEVRQKYHEGEVHFFSPERVSAGSATILSLETPEIFPYIRDGFAPVLTLVAEIEDDHGAIVSEEFNVTIRHTPSASRGDGFALIREFEFDRPLDLLLNDSNTNHFVFAKDSSADVATEIFQIDGLWRFLFKNPQFEIRKAAGEVPAIDKLLAGKLWFNLDPGSLNEFAIASEDENLLSWFAILDPHTSRTYSKEVEIEVEKPCHLAGRSDSGQDQAIVGQRQHGLTVLRIIPIRPSGFSHEGFEYEIISHAGAGRSLCYIYPTSFPAPIPGNIPASNLDDLIAIDFATNELVLYADYEEPAEVYEEIGVIPIQTNGQSGLKIIDVKSAGSPSEVPQVISILMTDGVAGGNHQLVTVSVDYRSSTQKIDQKVTYWTGDVPLSLHIGEMFGNEGRSIDISGDAVIPMLNSSRVMVLEDIRIDVVDDALGSPPVYADPVFFDIAPNASSVGVLPMDSLNGFDVPFSGLLVSYPDERLMRVYVDMD